MNFNWDSIGYINQFMRTDILNILCFQPMNTICSSTYLYLHWSLSSVFCSFQFRDLTQNLLDLCLLHILWWHFNFRLPNVHFSIESFKWFCILILNVVALLDIFIHYSKRVQRRDKKGPKTCTEFLFAVRTKEQP